MVMMKIVKPSIRDWREADFEIVRTGDLIKSFRKGRYKKFKNSWEEVKEGAELMKEWDCNTIAV